ncbi:MAG TPA: ATP-binding protein [Gemmatimonadales bacterium]|nr:ATP-binding protein [Gemmatimonadales bacterium]
MPESQRTEWKESWKDEYLKWLCGFANAEGGTLVIGRNDAGQIVGLSDAQRLLEELPNKIRDVLGIMADVRLKRKSGKEWLEIVVDPYPSPISYKGQYHYRSGSTKQELKGTALEQFLLKKRGRTWDAVAVPGVAVARLDREAFKRFRELARASGRMDLAALRSSDAVLVDRLRLIDGRYLQRAAVLLFHPDPERFVTGAFVKIGHFRSAADLAYHDEVHGPLFAQIHGALDLLYSKYLKAAITYVGIQRVETFPVPRAALREALLNAVVHRDYSVGAPIQIRAYDDRLTIWNPATLPDGWTAEKLLGDHASRPFNPAIAGVMFRAGEIEAWGQGVQRIVEACRSAGAPPPTLRYENSELTVEFRFAQGYLDALAGKPAAPGLGDGLGDGLGETRSAILAAMRDAPSVSTTRLAEKFGISTTAIDKHLKALRESGRIRRIGPAKGGHWEVLA